MKRNFTHMIAKLRTSASDRDASGIGSRLAAIRADHFMTQPQFAKVLGVSPRAYQTYERGESAVTEFLLIALYKNFGIEPLWVLTGSMISDSSLDLVAEIVSKLEAVLVSSGTAITPDKKGKAVKLFAQYFATKGDVTESEIAKLLSLME